MKARSPRRVRDGFGQILVYFGLAEEHGAKAERDPRRERIATVLVGVVVTWAVWDDRGAVIAIPVGIGIAVAALLGPSRPAVAEALATLAILPAGLAILFPDRTALWIPVTIGLALAALLTVAGRRQHRRPR